MLMYLISRLVQISCGLLYPAFCSYKAIKEKNARGYVRWMKYWITFGVFTSIEIITEPFICFWFPFYYELKICIVLSLVSGGGSDFAYRRWVHPALTRNERAIDGFIQDFTGYLYGMVSNLTLSVASLPALADRVREAWVGANAKMIEWRSAEGAPARNQPADATDGERFPYNYQRDRLDEILRRGSPDALPPHSDSESKAKSTAKSTKSRSRSNLRLPELTEHHPTSSTSRKRSPNLSPGPDEELAFDPISPDISPNAEMMNGQFGQDPAEPWDDEPWMDPSAPYLRTRSKVNNSRKKQKQPVKKVKKAKDKSPDEEYFDMDVSD